MTAPARIYLDNAATSWPKPEIVYDAVDQYHRQNGAPAGRSAYAEAMEVSEAVDQARAAAARVLGISDSRRVIFTSNGTDALNLAIHGLLRPGDHVVTSVAEHNSILRPLAYWREKHGVEIEYVSCDEQGVIRPEEIQDALRPTTALVALTHASNVTGAIQPVVDVATQLRDHPARLLVDAAQTAGHIHIDFESLGCDLLATPGHKGLLGPLGTGLLVLGEDVAESLSDVRQGGTGTQSEEDRQPRTLPEKFESGSHCVPGILGLGAALNFIEEEGFETLVHRKSHLVDMLFSGLLETKAVQVYGPRHSSENAGVVSCRVEGYDPQEVAAMLDAAYRIQVRAGLHCAPRMHRTLGTVEQGGTIRFSPGVFTTESDILAVLSAVREIAETKAEK